MFVNAATYLSSFWRAGFWSVLLVVGTEGAEALLGASVDASMAALFGIAVWVALLLIGRNVLVSTDAVKVSALRGEQPAHAQPSRVASAAEIVDLLSRIELPEAELALMLNRDDPPSSHQLLTSMIDDLREDILSWYSPIEALVWTLPAIGFLGSAWHMREAVRQTLENTSHLPAAQSALGPALLASLALICTALGLSVLTHVAVSLTLARDMEAIHPLKTALTLLIFEPFEVGPTSVTTLGFRTGIPDETV